MVSFMERSPGCGRPTTTANNERVLTPPQSNESTDDSYELSGGPLESHGTSKCAQELPGLLDVDHIRARGLQGYADSEDNSAFYRPTTWRLLLGVLSGNEVEQTSHLHTKRSQYREWKREFWGPRHDPDNDTSDFALVKEIEKDICRTRSELTFFVIGGVAHQWMLRILFIHAKLHPDIGYIQGMNEILVPLLFVYGNDSRDEWVTHAEADAFASFSSIMASMKPLYAPSPSNPTKSGVEIQMSRLMALLRQHDAVLWQHLNSIGVTPELFSVRWYMTLLTREFTLPTTLRVWDALLSDSKRFSFLHYVNCAMVRCRRSELLRCGFSAAVKCLQSPPPEPLDVNGLLLDADRMRARDREVDRCSAVPS